MTTMQELAACSRARIVELARAGNLTPRQLWVAARGASKYLAAVAAGLVRPQAAADECAAICARCIERDTIDTSLDGVSCTYCGTHDGQGKQGRTCGCLVSITIHGATAAAGKTLVSTEQCPQGMW